MVRLSRMRAYAGGMSSCAPSPPTALLGARLLCARKPCTSRTTAFAIWTASERTTRSATPRSLHRDVPLARSRSIAALVAQPSFPSGTGILAGRCWIVRGGAASSRVPPGRQSGSLAWARRFCGSSPGPGYPRCEGFGPRERGFLAVVSAFLLFAVERVRVAVAGLLAWGFFAASCCSTAAWVFDFSSTGCSDVAGAGWTCSTNSSVF